MSLVLNTNLRTLVLSTSRYTTIQACFFRANLRYNKRIYPVIKNEYFERGTLIDTLCNVYYKSRKQGIPVTEALNDALESGRVYAVKTQLPIEKTEHILERFVMYIHHYLNDDWKVIGVQAPFTKLVYQSVENNLQIVFEGLIDLVVETRMGLLIVDTKSTSKKADPRKINVQKMDNQFKMYCTVLEVNQICINEIGVQKGKTEDNFFDRRIVNFSNEILLEWLNGVVYWVESWLNHNEAGLFPQNTASCYGCDYTKVCSEHPSMRAMIIDRDYKVETSDFDIYKGEGKEEVVELADKDSE